MAKQIGFLKVQGTIGDITFVKTQDGYLAKQKGGIPGSRIATDPAFKRTRENNKEFGVAGKAGKIIRKAFNPQMLLVKDNRMSSRLVKEVMRVVKSDTTNRRGERQAQSGDLTLLQGFEFNNNARLNTNLAVPYGATIDRETGQLSISIPSFVPENQVIPPIGATHLKVRSAGGWIDFATGAFEVNESESNQFAINENTTTALQLTNQINPGSTQPLFLLMGLEFIQELNGVFYPLKDGSFNSMAIVLVDQEA